MLWLEKRFGFERAKIFWDMAEEAKALVRALIVRFAIPCDLRAGVIEALHKPSLLPEAAELVEALTGRYGYDRVTLLDRAGTIAALGSGALRRRHPRPRRRPSRPLSLRARPGARRRRPRRRDPREHAGASRSVATAAASSRTPRGEIRADHVIVATDGRSGSFEQVTRRRMVGINSFVVVTEPLGAEGEAILPGGESAADSRFVVRYWRKTPDGRLIFGGGESNAGRIPADVRSFVRPHLARNLSATRRDVRSRMAGAASSRSRRRAFLSCARSRRPSGRRAAIPARAWRSRRSSASSWRRRRRARRTAFRPSPTFPFLHSRSRHGCAARW